MRKREALFPLLLFAALLPACVFYLRHHPDERHYTDGAIEMLRTGDYLTPRTSQGEIRLRKPIITYWMVAASYRFAGIAPWSSRLPFAIAAAAICLLVYRTAKLLSGCDKTALFAAGLCATHPAVLLTGARSMPDIVLALGLTLSTYGFLGMILQPDRSYRYGLLGYLGAALAVESKGLPGAAFLTVILAALLFLDRADLIRHRRIHAIGLFLFLVVGGSWFAIMYWEHGAEVTRQFLGDQVAHRIRPSVWRPLVDLPLVVLVGLASFVLWLPILPNHRVAIAAIWSRMTTPQRTCLGVLASWCVAFLLLASCVHRVNLRYQVAIAPMACLIVAMATYYCDSKRTMGYLRRFASAGATTAIFVVLLTYVVRMNVPLAALVALTVLVIVAGALIYVLRSGPKFQPAVQITAGFSTLLLTVATASLSYYLLYESIDARLLSSLDLHRERDEPIVLVGKPAYAARLRVRTAGKLKVDQYRNAQAWKREQTTTRPAVLVLATDGPEVTRNLTSHHLEQIPNGTALIRFDQVRPAIRAPLRDLLSTTSDTITVAYLKQESTTDDAAARCGGK